MNTIKVKNTPLITVATVVLNAEFSIRKTIESVLSQTYPSIEYIVVDGLSSDNTLSIIHEYKDRISHIISGKDQCVYDAMNKALQQASGDFLLFMNAGDYFMTEYTVESMVEKMTSDNTIYYGNVVFANPVTKRTTFYGGKFSKLRLCFTNICHQSIFYPRSVYSRYLYSLEFPVFADHYYNIQLAKTHSFRYVDLIIAVFDTSGISTYRDDPMRKNSVRKKIVLENFGFLYYVIYLIKYYVRPRKWLRNIRKK